MKVLFVGDVHNHQYIFDDVTRLDKIYNFDRVIFLGDYVDDWMTDNNDSLKTLNKVIELKKSNLTYLNLAEVFMDMDDKNRAADAIQKITDKDYFEYKIELLKYLDRLPEALEAIISNKDCDNQLYLVRDILKRDSDGSLKRKVDELIAKYGELTGE